MDDEVLINRAVSAWYRYGGFDQPSRPHCSVEEISGRTYVALRNDSGILAVYRLTNKGQLRSLRRFPKELEVW